jgi:hypothetical protein
LDAERHQIEIDAFASSIKGFGRIIAVAANIAATEQYIQHRDAMQVRVVVEPPHPNCVTIAAYVQWLNNPIISATVSGLLVALITYIFRKAAGQKEEMRHLKEALETAIRELGNRDQKVVDRLLDTVDKMADALKPSARLAVNPVGRSVKTVTVTSDDAAKPLTLGSAEREAIESRKEAEITPEGTYEVLITEMNLDRSSCRVSLSDDPETRIAAEISDPAVSQPNNAYALAFAAKELIKVRAKGVVKEGKLDKLHISDTA